MPDQVTNYKGLPGIKGISEVARQQVLDQEANIDRTNFYNYVQQETEEYVKNSYLYNYTHPVPYKQEINMDLLPKDFGESRYDKYVTSIEDLADLNSFRSNQQSGFIQFVNGITKGLTTAGTTFIDGTLGTVYGLFHGANMAFNPNKDNPYLNDAQEFLGGFVSNPVNLRMREFNQFMEEFAPNYRSVEEMQKPWWQRAFSKGAVNFWADDIIKNIGFSIGALGASFAWNGLGQVTKAAQGIKKLIPSASRGIVQAIDNPTVGTQIVNGLKNGENLANPLEWMKKVSSFAKKSYKVDAGLNGVSLLLGATGEAQIEALESAETFRESQLNKATKYFKASQEGRLSKFIQENPQYIINGQLSTEGQKIFNNSEESLYNAYQDKVEAEAVRVGNNVFAYQTVLLSLTNAAAYGKLFGAGYASQSALSRQGRRFIGFDKEAGKYGIKKGLQKTANIIKVGSNPLLEGGEELGQAFISRTAEAYFDKKLNSTLLHEDLADKDSNESIANLINYALKAGVKESLGNQDAWLEFTSGFLMGAMGIPMIGRRKSGRVGLKLVGGVAADIKEVKEYNNLRQQAVDNLNEYLSKPENKELFKTAVLNQKYTKEMEEALEEGSPLLFKDNEHKARMTMAMAYQNANKLNDFYEMIDGYSNLSDADIDQLRLDTKDEKTKKSVYDDMSNAKVREEVAKNANQIKEKTQAFIDLTNDMHALYGDKFSRPMLQDIAFNMSLANEKRERSIKLAEEIKETVNKSLSDEMKIVDTQDLNAVLKSIESFGNLDKVKRDFIAYKKKNKDFKEDTTSTIANNIRNKTGLSIEEFDAFMHNLDKRSKKQIYNGIKNRGLEVKVIDLYLNIVDSKYNLISFAQALSNPKEYMQKVTEYYTSILKEEHDKKVKDIGDIEDEVKYNEEMDKLSPENQDSFEKEHIKTGSKAQAFAKKRQANTKLINTVDTYLNDKTNKHSEASKALVKKAFDNNKEAFKISIDEGMKAVEEELADKTTTHVRNVIEGIKSKLADIEELKAFYNTKKTTEIKSDTKEEEVDKTQVDPEELKTKKAIAVKAAHDLLMFRAEKSNSEVLYKHFMEGKSSNFSIPYSVEYLNAADMESVSINETDEEGKTTSEQVQAKFRIRVDYSTNKTQIYILKPSVVKNLGSSQQAFEDYAQKTPATYSVDGWGLTMEQIKSALLNAGVKAPILTTIKKETGKNVFLKDQEQKGFLSTDWANVSHTGDEELVKAYKESINDLNSLSDKKSNKQSQAPISKPVDDFISLEITTNKGNIVGYKKTTDIAGSQIYTINTRTKDGKSTDTLYPWIYMKNSSEYVDASEVEKLPKEFKNAESFKLHKIYERTTREGELDIIAEIVGENNKIFSIHLKKNYLIDHINQREERKALKTAISSFSGSKNFSVTEYDFRDDFENQAKESIITNDTDQFIYDVLKARGAYDFVNNGSLYKLWKANKDLQVKYIKINEAKDSSTIKLNKVDGVYFMYVEVDGRNQIIGNVKKDSEIYNKLIEAEKKGEQLINTIRDFKAGDVAVDEKVERDVAELMHSNQSPILAMITLSEDKQNPTLHVQDGIKITLDDIAGIHNWKTFSNAPVLLIPAANGKYVPRTARMRGIGESNFITKIGGNKLMIDTNETSSTNKTIMGRIEEAISTISKVTMKDSEAFDNSTYQEAQKAIKTLNELLLFRDSNKNNYKIDLYYNEESDEYFVTVHVEGGTAKRRFLTTEWETFKQYGAVAMKVNSAKSEDDGVVSEEKLKNISTFINEKIAGNDKRATITLDINDPEYNYKQLLSLINAINPLFNFDKQAFNNKQEEGITTKDWVDQGLLTTTVKLGRTYNGLFFINDDVKADVVRPKESFESNQKQYLNIGFASGTSLGYDIEYNFTAPTLIFKSITTATGKTTNRTKGLADAFNIKSKVIDLTNQKDFEQFENILKEYLRTNVDVSAYAVKNPNKEEYFFEVMINDKMYHYVVYKEYDKNGKLIDKKENIVPIEISHDGYIEMLEIMEAQNEDDDITENPNVNISETFEEQPIAKEQPNDEKEVIVKFNYSDKFTPQTKIPYEKREIILEDYLKIIENSSNPIATAKLFANIAKNKVAFAKMDMPIADFIDLSKEINKYAEAYVAIQNNNKDDIEKICKK